MVGVLAASLSGCGSGGGGVITGPGGAGRSACLQNAHKSGRAYWTVLIYINAANNLQPDSVTNVTQMEQVGSDSNLNIVIQWKQANCTDCGTPTFIGTHRYLVQKGGLKSLPDPANTPGLATVDMGNWQTLQQFVQWGVQNYPSDHLAVLIWDHGSGWEPIPDFVNNAQAVQAAQAAAANKTQNNRLVPLTSRSVSFDNETDNEIETQQIPQALTGIPVDMLIFDCSLEQMTEVAYQVHSGASQVRVMVGSEESPPGAGYPYNAWLGDLQASETTSNPCSVGDDIVRDFVAAYPTATDITQSVLDLSQMNTVASALANLSASLRTHINDQAALIASARDNAQSYAYPENKDLYHFANLLRTGAGAPSDLATAAANVQTALTNSSSGVVIYNGHGSSSQANSNGLAIYVPAPGDYDSNYGNLALSPLTHWDAFLQAQIQ
jgi:hypothetical protein